MSILTVAALILYYLLVAILVYVVSMRRTCRHSWSQTYRLEGNFWGRKLWWCDARRNVPFPRLWIKDQLLRRRLDRRLDRD